MFIDASKDVPKVSNTPTIRKTNDERCNLVVIISYLVMTFHSYTWL